jgi:hypothetical protein
MTQTVPSIEIQLPPHARIWQYIANRPLTDVEIAWVTEQAKQFALNWTAHNHQLAADTCVLFDQILILAVDENQAGASGCSIDKSTHFVESLGQKLDVDFFTRDLAFVQDAQGTVQAVTLSELSTFTPETLVFNTMAASLGALNEAWKPMSQSWQRRWMV